MATKKTVKLDSGYLNALMPGGVRGRMMNYSAEMMSGNYLIPQPVLSSSYIHNGFARLICDKPAEEMTRAGFTIVGMDEESATDIQSRMEELDAMKHFNAALKWCRAFGGGLIVLGIMDGVTDMQLPVNEDAVKGVEFMRVYDKFEATVNKRYGDPAKPEFGEIELWQISPATGGTGYLIHASRVLVFDGESVPNSVRVSNEGWGASVIQNAFIQLNRLDGSHKLALLLLERMQQAVHGIPGLSDLVSDARGEELVQKRIQVVDTVRGVRNTVVIDSEETYEIKSLSLSGINEILDRFAEALSSVTGIPVFILMGRSVGGLNSTGDASKEGWYAQIESWQTNLLKKPLDRLISLLRLGFSEGETDGDDYTLEFNPLFMPSDKEQSEIDNKQADTLTKLITAQVMDPDEAREVVRDKYNLIGDAPEPEPEPDPILDPIKLKEGETLVPHPGAPKPIVGNDE